MLYWNSRHCAVRRIIINNIIIIEIRVLYWDYCDPGTITESSICSKICLRDVSLIRWYTNDQYFLRSGHLNSTFALKLRYYLSPAYLFLRYSTTSPFSKFSRCCIQKVFPTLLSHLYCERSFTKLKITLSYIIWAVWGKIDSVIWPLLYHWVIQVQ